MPFYIPASDSKKKKNVAVFYLVKRFLFLFLLADSCGCILRSEGCKCSTTISVSDIFTLLMLFPDIFPFLKSVRKEKTLFTSNLSILLFLHWDTINNIACFRLEFCCVHLCKIYSYNDSER